MADAIGKVPTDASQAIDLGIRNHPPHGSQAEDITAPTQFPAYCSELQPGLHTAGPVKDGTLGNPAPLGLCGFALTSFLMGCISMGTRDITEPNIVVGAGFAYGGLAQLCAGM